MRRIALLLLAGWVLWGAPALAQPAPDARPRGGTVVAGAAAIASSPGLTSITQSTQRAAINWQSFNVGRNQGVAFAQPSATAMTLNRVTGPDPSQIAGRITANGQVVLVNPAGVTFFQGAQVNTNGLMVTAAGISNQNFMAGRMVFDQPAQPNARVENRGTLTIGQAGLAALVAPQVVNSGVITARLGHVVLAGAQAATLDMYGDGLVSIDVTRQVQQVPTGPDGKPVTALVTNTGLIRADGGTVQLTAQAADGIVQTLVNAGGRIHADTADGHTGNVVLSGLGGSIVVAGQVTARGDTPGSTGGNIVANGDGDVLVQSGAHLDASGRGGGGVIAVGTTLQRAQSGPGTTAALTARRTRIDAGATVTADAIDAGNGGRVVVLSQQATVMSGSLTARGGGAGGDGGFVEASSDGVLAFTGSADVSAPAGTTGTILFDPLDLVISDQPQDTFQITNPNAAAPNVTADGFPDAKTTSWISPTVLEQLSGNVEVQTTQDLFVESPLLIGFNSSTIRSLTLNAGRNLTVYSPPSAGPASPMLGASGDIVLLAGTGDPTGAISLNGAVVSQYGSVFLSAPANVFIGSAVIANNTGRNSGVTGKLISIRTDSLGFDGGSLDVAGGTIEVAPYTTGLKLVVGGDGSGELDLPPLPVVTATGFATPNLRLGATTDPASGQLIVSAGDIAIDGPLYDQNFDARYASGLNGANLELDAQGTVSQSVALQSIGTLSGQAANLALDQDNTIATLGRFIAGNAIVLNDIGPLTITGPLQAPAVVIVATGQMTLAGNITSPELLLAVLADEAGTGQFTQTGTVTVIGGGLAPLAAPPGAPIPVSAPSLGSTPTMVVLLPATGGSASFANLSAAGMQFVLYTGSGTATGTMQVAGLLLYGQGGSATLVGSVAGLTTQAAAAVAQIVPAIDPHYTFNGCTIGLASCVPPPPPIVPPPVVPPPPQIVPPAVIPRQTITLALAPLSGGLSIFLPGTYLPMAPAITPVNLRFVGGIPPAFGELAGPDVVLPNISFQDY